MPKPSVQLGAEVFESLMALSRSDLLEVAVTRDVQPRGLSVQIALELALMAELADDCPVLRDEISMVTRNA